MELAQAKQLRRCRGGGRAAVAARSPPAAPSPAPPLPPAHRLLAIAPLPSCHAGEPAEAERAAEPAGPMEQPERISGGLKGRHATAMLPSPGPPASAGAGARQGSQRGQQAPPPIAFASANPKPLRVQSLIAASCHVRCLLNFPQSAARPAAARRRAAHAAGKPRRLRPLQAPLEWSPPSF